jgi:hypothetical protein
VSSAPSHLGTRSLTAAVAATSLALSLGCAGVVDAFEPTPVPADSDAFVGCWEGASGEVEVELCIAASGQLEYHRQEGITRTELNVSIQSWSPDGFDAGVGPLVTHFDVQEAPARVDSQWQMTIDGVTLYRAQ